MSVPYAERRPASCHPHRKEHQWALCKPCFGEEYFKRRGVPAFVDQANKYGATREELQALYRAQRGLCGICSTPLVSGRRGLHVDHYEREDGSKVVRGLLCAGCNVGIAQLGHSIPRIRAAFEYLDKRRAA